MFSYDYYQNICLKAVEDDEVFKDFKRNPLVTAMLEHVTYGQGLGYIAEIRNQYPLLLDCIRISANDDVGNPVCYFYENLDRFISPSTLRYVKVLADLLNIFGSLDELDIVEIGGGYGGQCKIITDFADPKSYTIIDLPFVLLLTKKYLEAQNVEGVTFVEHSDVESKEYDLCISNYAFTEINRKYQEEYAEKIIKNSKHGYITCNYFGMRDDGMTKKEVEKLRNGKFIDEKPLTGTNNVIYIW